MNAPGRQEGVKQPAIPLDSGTGERRGESAGLWITTAAVSSMTTTQAIRIERLGAPEVLVERDVPLADPGPNEVHLRILASGVNFADLVMRAGLYGTVPDLPYSPGFEVAGEIVRVGTAVQDWKPGDRAAAVIRFGGYARDAIVPTRNLFPYPDTLSPAEAAAIPVVFLTAWIALFEAARVRAGETALVLVAAGGVGSAAVQLGKRAGLRVVGTAGGERKCRFVVDDLGADACFDSSGRWDEQVRTLVGDRGIDCALDSLGGRATAACRRLLAPLGRLVFIGMGTGLPGRKRSWPAAVSAYLRTPRFHPLDLVEPSIGIFGIHLLHLQAKEALAQAAMHEIYQAAAAREIRPVLDKIFPLTRDGAVEAHHYLHDRKNLGKVVLAV
jgi:NADPH:quinone reductase-like Zn-dependent oxidoreductase